MTKGKSDKNSKQTKTVVKAEKNVPLLQNKNVVIVSSILVLTVFVFGTLAHNGFFWDDYDYITINPQITKLSLQGIFDIFSTFRSSNYHPLTTLSWAVEYHFWGLQAAGYHITNLVIHLINIVLVFTFARLLLKDIRVATFTAVVFAIHPMHVESVAWISERKDVLYTLFYVLGLCLYVKYLNTKKAIYVVFTFAAFLLSCLSKSAAITLPLMLILIDYYKENFSLKTIVQKIPFLAVSLVFGIVAIISQRSGNAVNQDIVHFGFIDRIFLLCYSVYYYLVSFVVPGQLCSVHYYPKAGIVLPMQYYVAAIVLVLLLLASLFVKKYRRELIFGFGFYAISISLVLQLIPLGKSIVAERYSYVPYIGLAIMVAKIALDALSSVKHVKTANTVVYICFGVCVISFSVQSYQRSVMWKDAYTLYTDVINKNPDESFSYWLRCYDRLQANDYAGCVADCNKGIALDSNSIVLYANRAVAKYYLTDYKGSVADYTKVLLNDPSNNQVYYNRAKSKSAMQDFASAIPDYEKALAMQGINKNNVFMCLDLAYAKLSCNDAPGAIAVLDKALAIDSHLVFAYFSKGNCYLQLQQYQQAIQNYSLAVQYDANFDKAICNRGVAKLYMGDGAGACADFKRAGDLGNPDARSNFARCK